MRIATLVIAILSGIASAALAIKWLSDAHDLQGDVELIRAAGMSAELDSVLRGAYGLLAAAAVGLVGGILTMKGKGKLAAALFVVAIAVPAIFTGKTLLGTCLFAIAAVLALLAKPPARSFA